MFWYIRGVRSKKAIHRLKHLININKITFAAIIEPFVDMNKIEGYRKFLGFQYCKANINGKIWCFWSYFDQFEIIANEEQQLSINFKETAEEKGIVITTVYAKCTSVERRDHWSNFEYLNDIIDGPWCVGGVFNVIMDSDEKFGGRPHRARRRFDFINTMENCGLADIGFIGLKFTW